MLFLVRIGIIFIICTYKFRVGNFPFKNNQSLFSPVPITKSRFYLGWAWWSTKMVL